MVEWLSNLSVFKITGFVALVIGLLGGHPAGGGLAEEGKKFSILNHHISDMLWMLVLSPAISVKTI